MEWEEGEGRESQVSCSESPSFTHLTLKKESPGCLSLLPTSTSPQLETYVLNAGQESPMPRGKFSPIKS